MNLRYKFIEAATTEVEGQTSGNDVLKKFYLFYIRKGLVSLKLSCQKLPKTTIENKIDP